MVEMPSIGGWISKQSLLWQLNFNMMMKMSPIFIFMFGNSLCRGMGYSQEFSLAIPGMIGAGFFILFLYWDFGNRNQSTAMLPLNMTITWSPTNTIDIYPNIIDYVILNDDPAKGTLAYGVKFDRPQEDDKGGKFQHAIFLSPHPIDKAFRRIPKQFVAYGGSVFEGMAGRIWATYLNEFQDVGGYNQEEMSMDEFKIFHVKCCVEDAKSDQIKMGLYDENPLTKEVVAKAVQLEIDRKATRLGMQLRESEGQLQSFSEAYQDAETRSKKIVNRLIDDIDRIKKERSLMTRLMRDKWVRVIMIMILIGVGFYVARYYKVI